MSIMPSPNQLEVSSPLDVMSSGLSKQWLRLGNYTVLLFVVKDTRRSTIDLWADTLIKILLGWSPEKPLFLIGDFSDPRNALTPYARYQIERVFHCRLDLVTYVANILPNTFIMQIAILFLNKLRNPTTHLRNFMSMQAATAWIEQKVASLADESPIISS